MNTEMPTIFIGCDFSSAPGKRKPIVVARGERVSQVVRLLSIDTYASLAEWAQSLLSGHQPTLNGGRDLPGIEKGWVGGFDFPFGLPRELVEALDWPKDWEACVRYYASLSRDNIRAAFKSFCDARPVGGKFAHRATDGPAGSSPSMKWVNPPVAFMMHAGLPPLLEAGVHLPGLRPGDARRVALEAYPGMWARQVLGHQSYKADDKARQNTERWVARRTLVEALEMGQAGVMEQMGVRLKLTHGQRDLIVADASGDTLDAVICMLQAVWAGAQHESGHPQWGLPPFDPLEGWIVSAPLKSV